MTEQQTEMYEWFGLSEYDDSALATAIKYLAEGGSSNEYIRMYARGYAECAVRYTRFVLDRFAANVREI